ncbi:hypothetical protein BCR44DRAFT_1427391 [Catenaria anguillulae PL171]|uniref:Uncharacterized protein n=1 Tax=Catenaria anguillulae PL171 TaxID=765915 RepID=A0A1Y2HXF4_9FUNG|nr:hypothetical protein BCR44DRAFT_1427391 [Catenaria anguillulae PL171]
MQLANADPRALQSCLAGWNATAATAGPPSSGAKKPDDESGASQPQVHKADDAALDGASKHPSDSSSSPPLTTTQKYGTALFSYLSRERGSFERITDHIAPRSHPLKRRRGLLAVPVSGKSKAQIAPVLARFRQEHFDIMLFHYDAADWSDVPHYNEFTSIRVFGQTKFWFAKRFLVPELVENYDYVFLWDDDVGLDAMWSPTQFVAILQQYGIHAAQPALSEGARPGYPQYETVRFHPETIWKKSVGRFADFVEVMFPVFSREAWQNCIWETIPYDGRSFWGVDNAWYPHCSSLGYCRFAIIDALPVAHLDQRSLYQPQQNNLREFGHYTNMYKRLCSNRPADLDPAATLRVIMICNFIRRRPLGWSFNSLAAMDPIKDGGEKGRKRCPEPSLWPGIENKPWFGDAVDEPVKYQDAWVDKVLARAAQVHIGHDHREKQPEVAEDKKDKPKAVAPRRKSRGKKRARRNGKAGGGKPKPQQQKKTQPVVQQVRADAAA